jgi:hypothetical protein
LENSSPRLEHLDFFPSCLSLVLIFIVLFTRYVEKRGYSSSIPKPIRNLLDRPKGIKFVIQDDKTIKVEPGQLIEK